MSHLLANEEVELLIGGEARTGTIDGSDRAIGISLVSVPTGTVAPIAWGDQMPQPGDVVFALGDPGTGLRITEGRVSAAPLSVRGRSGRLVDGIEHTAPLPRGSGGGPLVDADGIVIGLNVLRTDPGFLFAIAATAVRPAVERLLAGAPESGRLGVSVAPPAVARRLRRAVGLPDREGLLVLEVEDRSAAASAGIQRGDLIVGLGDAEISSLDSLFAVLERPAPQPTTLKLVRGAEELELAVSMGGELR